MTDNPAMDPLSLAFRIAGVFDDLGIPYAIGGAVASAIHGEPRATEDLDVVAAIEVRHVQALIGRLQPEYYVPVGLPREAVEHHGSFNVIHLASMRKVDVFVAGRDELARQELARRVPHTLPERSPASLWIASPEDTILHKLRWYGKGSRASDRQWRDVLGVIKVQARRPDRRYLETWAVQVRDKGSGSERRCEPQCEPEPPSRTVARTWVANHRPEPSSIQPVLGEPAV